MIWTAKLHKEYFQQSALNLRQDGDPGQIIELHFWANLAKSRETNSEKQIRSCGTAATLEN